MEQPQQIVQDTNKITYSIKGGKYFGGDANALSRAAWNLYRDEERARGIPDLRDPITEEQRRRELDILKFIDGEIK